MKKMHFFAITASICAVVCLLSCGGLPPAEPMEASKTTAKVFFMLPDSAVTVTGLGSVTIGTQFTLWDNDTYITSIGGKEYIALNFNAGTHYFMATAGEGWNIVRAELAAGRTYYIKLTTLPGFRAANVSQEGLDPNNPEIPNYLKDSKEIITPKGKTPEAWIKTAGEKLSAIKSGAEKVEVVIPASRGK